MRRTTYLLILVLAAVALLVAGCSSDDEPSGRANVGEIPANAITISIIYAPESDLYMQEVIANFNESYRTGTNPVTGQRLADGEQPIYVTGEPGSSGTIMQRIVNAVITPTSDNIAQPVIFSPSVSHWLALANYQAGRDIFDLSDARATALAPVVMAIWESRLEAIRETVGYEEIGWEELLMVLDSPNGWQDFGIEGGRRTVYYGHTDPFISSTALSTLIAEFYASARREGFDEPRLTRDIVNNEDVQQGVRDIEALIRHYSRRTTEFKEYIAQGPSYLDFVALEENDLIFINLGRTQVPPPEPLVALYPKEGTFWHEHPFGIVNASWVTAEQQAAARVFTDYVLTPAVQERIMQEGFRPANPDVPLGFPFTPDNGVTVEGPSNVLNVPAPEVIAAIQESWAFVKKQADIWLVIDVSLSMESDNKLEQAKTAALAFLDNVEDNVGPSNRIGLAVFSDTVQVLVEMDNYEVAAPDIRREIQGLRPQGGTELYRGVIQIVGEMNKAGDEDRIRAVVLLSDGEDTGEPGVTLNDVTQVITESSGDLNPVIVVPVAYGEGAATDAAARALSTIARASNTRVQSGDPTTILEVLEIISSYF